MKEKIKQLIKFIKKYSGETMLVIGTGLFIYNIFNFSFKTIYKIALIRQEMAFLNYEIIGVAYYYLSNTLMCISIGAMLIVAGILIIKNRNEK